MSLRWKKQHCNDALLNAKNHTVQLLTVCFFL